MSQWSLKLLRYTEQVIPQIFYFLVHLSYEKNHSKAIIGIPEVIQLCDGLMASGQSPVTHCIPALIPVVEDVFMMRGGATTGSHVAELDTQREVLVAVLLRLVEYHQVLELLAMILRQSYSDKERWNRWSRKVAGTLLPLLAHGQVRLECRTSQTSLISLLDSLAPSASELVVPMLNVLFSQPPSAEDPDYNVAIQRWLGAILGVLSHLLVHSTEDEVLEQLALHNINVPQTIFIDQDPLNVTRLQCSSSPDIVFTRLIFQIIEIVTNQVCKVVICPVGPTYEADYLKEQIAHFLLYCIYMLESGSYRKVATATMVLVQKPNICNEDDQLHVENINKMFLRLAPFCPLLTFLWCYMLVLMGHNSLKFWAQALYTGCSGAWNSMIKRNLKATPESMQPTFCCNLEIVRRGAVILFSDFVCDNLSDLEQLSWLLMNHIEDIVHLSKEIPVQELIAAIHRSPRASNLLVQAIASKCQELTQPSTVALLLQQCLEGIHPDQTGAVLKLLASRYLNLPQLALSRQARALASKRAEMLLLSSDSEVLAQLSKEDLQQLLVQIGNRHEGLKNILRKVGTEFYKLALDDASQNFDPTLVNSINVDGSWFLTQIKHKCCHPDASGTNLSVMLSDLSLKDILCVMGSPKFNLAILEECIKRGRNLSFKEITTDSVYKVSPLFEAAQATLLHRIKRIEGFLPRPHQVFQPIGRNASAKEQKFSQRLIVSLADHVFLHSLIQLAGVVPIYFESLARLNLYSHLSSEHQADFAKFGVLCLEVAHWQIKAADVALNPGALEATLTCAAAVLSHPNIAHELGLPGTYTWLASACNAIFAMTTFMVQFETLPLPFQAKDLTNVNEDSENFCIIQACPQISTLISWLEKSGQTANLLLQSLYEPIKKVIIGLARLSPLNSYAATPPEVWHHGWDVSLEGPSSTLVPPLPVELLLETEILEQFIYRLTLLGWTSRQQFEENWMALLGVLNSNRDEETMSSEEASAMLQASGLAVKGITALLVQSLLLPTPGNPIASNILHQPRELPQVVPSDVEKQMRKIHNLLVQQVQDSQMTSTCSWQFDDVFHRPNLERVGLNSIYGYSQMSLHYLLRVIKASEDQSVTKPAPYLQREQCLIANGIDVHSCLHFLLDLYTQWTQPQAQTPLLLLLECVRSVLMISEIFTERAQFQWMLHTFIELGKSHPAEDELLHQFLTLGVCKASSVLSQEEPDVLDKVRKMTDNSLRSGFLPSRLCGLHGVLHLLQSSRCLSQTPADETLQLAIDYIQRHMDLASGSSSHSERHLLALWALVFFLLEAEQVTESEMAPAVLQLALALVSAGNQVISLNSALIQGLEKLVLCGTVRGHVGDQVTKVALEKLKHPNHMNFLPGLQLLLTCMYTGKLKPEQSGEENKDEINPSDADPEILLQSLEKTSALFDRIKKGYPHEVELICGVLPTLLSDFFPPSEMLTKVIGEFLSQQQPHPRLLAGVVSQLFERACSQEQLPLIQDWVVLSLSNFTQCSPVGMAVWCLTCFFVSASSNYWLRAMFPHIQSRIGRCEVEDCQLLCLTAWDFYQKLSASQKQDFIAAFQVTVDPHSPILNIISCL
ncbi:hypothetical protein B566_EDAN008124 [Ephemera danica]|nr:hypothetical protein B566_EDAN008124 [Ephemera danica]